ncbi:MAG TPA: peptide chain release factor-like protein, partial [Myxococcota bacterium]
MPRGGAAFDVERIEEGRGFAALAITGKNARALFAHEPGGHRWQRVPPNEKRGRVHTSTVTVAVLDVDDSAPSTIRERDVRFEEYQGSGAGGQHRNKTMSCIQAIHVPTGIEARAESERSQHQNKRIALAVLSARVQQREKARVDCERARERREQVGSGQRGDKVRTVRVQDGVVTCERTGRRTRLREYLRGDLS